MKSNGTRKQYSVLCFCLLLLFLYVFRQLKLLYSTLRKIDIEIVSTAQQKTNTFVRTATTIQDTSTISSKVQGNKTESLHLLSRFSSSTYDFEGDDDDEDMDVQSILSSWDWEVATDERLKLSSMYFRRRTLPTMLVREAIDLFRNQGGMGNVPYRKIHIDYVHQLINETTSYMSELPSLVNVSLPFVYQSTSTTNSNEFATTHKKVDQQTFFDDKNIPVTISLSNAKSLTIVGDIHGNLYNLLSIFETNGLPSPSNPYLFNGDFVDKGFYGLETMLLLLLIHSSCGSNDHDDAEYDHTFKSSSSSSPHCVLMNRGNHDGTYGNGRGRSKFWVQVELNYGNQQQQRQGQGQEQQGSIVNRKLNENGNDHPSTKKFSKVFESFSTMFRNFPYGHYLIHEKILIVHGGISWKRHQITKNRHDYHDIYEKINPIDLEDLSNIPKGIGGKVGIDVRPSSINNDAVASTTTNDNNNGDIPSNEISYDLWYDIIWSYPITTDTTSVDDKNHHDDDEESSSSLSSSIYFGRNDRLPYWGMKATELFIQQTNISYILRSHICTGGKGYDSMTVHDGHVHTVFSTPDQCSTGIAAYIKLDSTATVTTKTTTTTIPTSVMILPKVYYFNHTKEPGKKRFPNNPKTNL